jgi:hypothetical protein
MVLLAVSTTMSVLAQGSAAQVEIAGRGLVSGVAPGDVVREIDDPHTGARWLLLRDSDHPGGPGRLVLVSETRTGALPAEQTGMAALSDLTPLKPVVRAGDRVIVEESSPVVEARLEAVALGPAVVGSAFNVRLKIGGKIVRALALAPGRAALALEMEARQ